MTKENWQLIIILPGRSRNSPKLAGIPHTSFIHKYFLTIPKNKSITKDKVNEGYFFKYQSKDTKLLLYFHYGPARCQSRYQGFLFYKNERITLYNHFNDKWRYYDYDIKP